VPSTGMGRLGEQEGASQPAEVASKEERAALGPLGVGTAQEK